MRLPPSYRQFLQVTGGWPMIAPLLGRLWSTTEVDGLAVRHPALIESWLMGTALQGDTPWEHGSSVSDEERFVSGDEQDPVRFEPDHLRTALEISDLDPRDDAIYLLNSQVVTPDGAWEAWYLASWLPGARRYRSFWDMMETAYEGFRRSLDDLASAPPEFLDYARQRLQSRPDARCLAARLPDLIRTLDQAAESTLSPPPAGRPPTLPAYQRTMAEGIRMAAARVRQIQDTARDPQEVVDQLASLAGELQRQTWAAMQATMKNLNLKQVLLTGTMAQLTGSVNGLDALIGPSGDSAGYMSAASFIHAFLDER